MAHLGGATQVEFPGSLCKKCVHGTFRTPTRKQFLGYLLRQVGSFSNAEIAAELMVSRQAVWEIQARLKQRCPWLYAARPDCPSDKNLHKSCNFNILTQKGG